MPLFLIVCLSSGGVAHLESVRRGTQEEKWKFDYFQSQAGGDKRLVAHHQAEPAVVVSVGKEFQRNQHRFWGDGDLLLRWIVIERRVWRCPGRVLISAEFEHEMKGSKKISCLKNESCCWDLKMSRYLLSSHPMMLRLWDFVPLRNRNWRFLALAAHDGRSIYIIMLRPCTYFYVNGSVCISFPSMHI